MPDIKSNKGDLAIEPLRKRSDFVRLNHHGQKCVTSSFILLSSQQQSDAPVRVGFTVTKKIGNAVTRNRVRRRLREAARAQIPSYGSAARDYVFIARHAAITCEYDVLLRDMRYALKKTGQAPQVKAAI